MCSIRRRLRCLCRRPSFANRPSVTSSAWYTALGAATESKGTFQGFEDFQPCSVHGIPGVCIFNVKISTSAWNSRGVHFQCQNINLCPGIPQIDLGGGHPRDSPAQTSGMSVPSRLTAVIECANLETIAKIASLKRRPIRSYEDNEYV